MGPNSTCRQGGQRVPTAGGGGGGGDLSVPRARGAGGPRGAAAPPTILADNFYF